MAFILLVIEANLNMKRVVSHFDEPGVRLGGLTCSCRHTAMPMLKAVIHLRRVKSAQRKESSIHAARCYIRGGMLQTFAVGNRYCN